MEDGTAEKLLDAYRHVRHDYMNHFQVIMGYLQLGNLERAREYALLAAQALSRYDVLSHIRLPGLAALVIYCLNACSSGVGLASLEIKTEGVFESWKEEDGVLTHMLESLLLPIIESVSQGEYSCRIILKAGNPAAIEIFLEGDPDKARLLLAPAADEPVFSWEIITAAPRLTGLVITKKET